jgi:hypothetical protein
MCCASKRRAAAATELRPNAPPITLKFMAKFKSAGSKKTSEKVKSARAAIPCLVIVALGIALMCLLFYFSLQSGITQ